MDDEALEDAGGQGASRRVLHEAHFNSDAAVHIELCDLFFVPRPDVGHPKQGTQVEAAMDQIKRQLAAAVNVARQRQVNAQLGVIKEMRVVSQQDVDRFRHHQPFDPIYGPVAIARFY